MAVVFNLFEELKNDYMRGRYQDNSEVPEMLPEGAIIDPALTELENRAIVDLWNANAKFAIQMKEATNARLIRQLREDAVRMVMGQYCLSREIAERIESLCWKDKHAHMEEYFAFLPQLAQLVFESCWEAFHAS